MPYGNGVSGNNDGSGDEAYKNGVYLVEKKTWKTVYFVMNTDQKFVKVELQINQYRIK